MAKYLYIDGGGVGDYAAITFEREFNGNALELWEKSHAAGDESFEYDEGDVYFWYQAKELDEATVEEMKSNMDYDDSKHANYFKVEN